MHFAGSALTGRAVDAATDAFPDWAATPPPQRSQVLFRYHQLLVAHRDTLAALVTEENGKTLAESRAEVDRGMQVVEFAAGIAHLIKGEHLGDVALGLDRYSLREPLGPYIGITPFNSRAMSLHH